MSTHWITTYSGHTFDAANPTPADVRAIDVAHALGHLCRFTGHTSRFYSVLEHSLFVLEVGRARFTGSGTFCRCDELALLLHDAHEAYINDISTPIKALIGDDYRVLKDRYDDAIAERFGFTRAGYFDTAFVAEADAHALRVEAWDLLPDHGIVGGINPAGNPPRNLTPGRYDLAIDAPDVDDLRKTFLYEIIRLTDTKGNA